MLFYTLLFQAKKWIIVFESQLSSHTYPVSLYVNSTPVTFVITVVSLRKFAENSPSLFEKRYYSVEMYVRYKDIYRNGTQLSLPSHSSIEHGRYGI